MWKPSHSIDTICNWRRHPCSRWRPEMTRTWVAMGGLLACGVGRHGLRRVVGRLRVRAECGHPANWSGAVKLEPACIPRLWCWTASSISDRKAASYTRWTPDSKTADARAGSSVWSEHRTFNPSVLGSNPSRPTMPLVFITRAGRQAEPRRGILGHLPVPDAIAERPANLN